MATISDGLTTPFPGVSKYAAVEKLRAALMRHVYPLTTTGGVVSPSTAEDCAARVLGWVMQSDLRSIIPDLEGINGVFSDGPNTLQLSRELDSAELPPLAAFQRSVGSLGLSPSLIELLGPWIQSPLPQRRIEGYCALACVCAMYNPAVSGV